MIVTCQQNLSHTFEITDEDQAFYTRMEVPPPTLCPTCRVQRRMSFRNFRRLYERKCDLTGKEIISMYAPGKSPNYTEPFKVYDLDAWWSDAWDPLSYGRPYDFNRPFFDQVRDLMQVVPKFAVYNFMSENCRYSNLTFYARNCYLVFGCIKDEDCYYGHIVWESQSCVDGLYIVQCERCYECVDCTKCYNLKFSQDCEGCFDSSFLYDCRSCNDCFGCVGLRGQKYHIFNQPYSKEEYRKKMEQFSFCNAAQVAKVRETVESLKLRHPRLYMHAINAENCTGDYVYGSKDCHFAFDVKNSENVKFAYTIKDFKDSYDVNFMGTPSELCLEALTCSGYRLRFCQLCQGDNAYLDYCTDCSNCKYCFGCVGLKSRSYCIFNKQYMKEEYEELTPRIIAQMQSEKSKVQNEHTNHQSSISNVQFGEFFPPSLSYFGYNQTIANEYYPLEGSQATAQGFGWLQEEAATSAHHGAVVEVPRDIAQIGDDIVKRILRCESCGKNYKIIAQELRFYREAKLPIPRTCFHCRHLSRMALRNPRYLFDRTCMKCAAPITTTYAPDRKETVYCEKCYQGAVY